MNVVHTSAFIVVKDGIRWIQLGAFVFRTIEDPPWSWRSRSLSLMLRTGHLLARKRRNVFVIGGS
jgi:hypothetical protein